MIAHTAKVMPILLSVLMLIGFFLTSCVGINLGDIPRGLQHPQDGPSVDPSTFGRKTLYELASLKYCYITGISGKEAGSRNLGTFSKRINFNLFPPEAKIGLHATRKNWNPFPPPED